jgi:hypothetical protein
MRARELFCAGLVVAGCAGPSAPAPAPASGSAPPSVASNVASPPEVTTERWELRPQQHPITLKPPIPAHQSVTLDGCKTLTLVVVEGEVEVTPRPAPASDASAGPRVSLSVGDVLRVSGRGTFDVLTHVRALVDVRSTEAVPCAGETAPLVLRRERS